MDATAKWVDGLKFEAVTSSNNRLMMDSGEGITGGARPKELLLIGLAGCTAMDVVSILQKQRVEFDSFQVETKADITDEHPKVFKDISIIYRIKGKNISEEKVRKAIELSQNKYCGVSAMLKKNSGITYKYIIEES
jgi:putative redox protein